MSIQDDPTEIAAVDPEADPVVYYRPGQVIAVGPAAHAFVGRLEPEAEVVTLWEGRNSEGKPANSPQEPAYLFTVAGDPMAIVEQAQVAGHHVQLNHVFFANANGPQADPCCDKNSPNHPPTAAPFRATPFRATSPKQTSAVPARPSEILKSPLGGPVAGSARPKVKIWIMDTGTMASGIKTPLEDRSDYIKGGATDSPDKMAPPGVDAVAGHGTFIAGIIEQLTPGCDIWISDVIESSGKVQESDVATAIHGLVAKHTSTLPRTILNLSFSGGVLSPSTSLLGDEIAAAQKAGVVVVASAGNEESCRPVYPAHFKDVVAVAALHTSNAAADFTNRGDWVDACALGVDIVSTFFHSPPVLNPKFEGWAVWSGTSFAAPVVVAAIAAAMATNGQSAKQARASVVKGQPRQCLGVPVGVGAFSNPLKAENP